jgi:hypothetical protein
MHASDATASRSSDAGSGTTGVLADLARLRVEEERFLLVAL